MAIYYMETVPFRLTNIETEESKEFNDLQGLLDEALAKTNTIYFWDLDKLAEPLINKFYKMGYTEIPTADLDAIDAPIQPKQFVQIGSIGSEGNCTYQIRIRRNTRAQSLFKNASKLFGDTTIEELITATIGEEDLDFEAPVMCERLSGLIAKGHTALTLAGNAKKDLMDRCFGREINGKVQFGWKNFNDRFPKLSTEEHDFVFSSFQGGICYFNPKYIGSHDVSGTEYDVNSMYPAVMLEELLPYGKPVAFEGQYVPVPGKGFPLYFQEVNIGKMTIKPDGIPCIRRRGYKISGSKEQGYYTIEENVNLVLNHVDLEMLFDNYTIENIEYVGGYRFEGRKKMFDKYINYWAEQKKNAEYGSFERMYAKLMLNSAFGKFASKTDKQPSYYKYSKYNQRYIKIPYVRGKKRKEGSSLYAPVGCYITSYARQRLIAAIKNNKDAFIYSDTDSIYVKGEAKGLEIDPKKLGAWKEEFKFTKMNIIGKKQYCVQKTDGTVKVVLAGVPDYITEEIDSYDEFYIGKEFTYIVWGYNEEGYTVIKDEPTTTLKDKEIK